MHAGPTCLYTAVQLPIHFTNPNPLLPPSHLAALAEAQELKAHAEAELATARAAQESAEAIRAEAEAAKAQAAAAAEEAARAAAETMAEVGG